MPRKNSHRKEASCKEAPASVNTTPKEDDVKVPIEVNDDQKKADSADVGTTGGDNLSEAKDSSSIDEDEEEKARVEAAIRAGEQAAEKEIQADASKKLRDAQSAREELQKKLDSVQSEIDAAKKEASETSDRLVRLQADWDNYRRRTAQERVEEKQRAGEELVVSLLPVLDDMERALEHADHATATGDMDEQFAQFVAGVQAVHDKMLSILKKRGVEVIDPKGEAFDPLKHQAVGRVEDKDAFDETVAEVYQRGYRMAGKVIREAMVQVTFGGPKRPVPEEAKDKATGSDNTKDDAPAPESDAKE